MINDTKKKFIDLVIEWVNNNKLNKIVEVEKKILDNSIQWTWIRSNSNTENNCTIMYYLDKNIYECAYSVEKCKKYSLSWELIKNSDYCEIKYIDYNILIQTNIPDFICICMFELNLTDLSKINGSIFYKNKFMNNNEYISNLLEKKSHSLIISRYSSETNSNHYKLSFYKLLKQVYENNDLFDIAIRYLVLFEDNLCPEKIKYFDSFVKSKSILDYKFMHKYLLKTPEFVIKKILHIDKTILSNLFSIRYEEKNFTIRYESNNLEEHINDKHKHIHKHKHTQILLLLKIFIKDEIENYEYNIFNFYLNKLDENSYHIEKVIFNSGLKTMIYLSDYFVEWAKKNIGLDLGLNNYDKLTYNYSDWVNKYFGTNIQNYLKN